VAQANSAARRFTASSVSARSGVTSSLPRHGHQVVAAVDQVVVHLGLRHQPGRLAAHGHQRLVVEQRPCAVAGGVDDGAFPQSRQLARILELAVHDLAAFAQEVVHQQPRVRDEVEGQLRVAAYVRHVERVLRGVQRHRARPHVADARFQLGVLWFFIALCEGQRLVERNVGQQVAVVPFDRLAWQAQQTLIGLERGAGHGFPALHEFRRGVFRGAQARVGRPHAGGCCRADLGRPVLAVDAHAQAGALRDAGGGQADGTAADDGDVLLARRQDQRQCFLGRAPGQRPSAAAMAVVVDNGLAVEALGLDARALRAEGARGDGDVDDAVGAGADGGQRRGRGKLQTECREIGRHAKRSAAAKESSAMHAGGGSVRGHHFCRRFNLVRSTWLRSPVKY
jgi:hypothetical protein